MTWEIVAKRASLSSPKGTRKKERKKGRGVGQYGRRRFQMKMSQNGGGAQYLLLRNDMTWRTTECGGAVTASGLFIETTTQYCLLSASLRYKDTRHGQHFRNGSVVALKQKFISISPNLGAQCVQLDQSDCLLWWAFEVWPIRLFVLHTLWKFWVTQALLGHASYLFICDWLPVRYFVN